MSCPALSVPIKPCMQLLSQVHFLSHIKTLLLVIVHWFNNPSTETAFGKQQRRPQTSHKTGIVIMVFLDTKRHNRGVAFTPVEAGRLGPIGVLEPQGGTHHIVQRPGEAGA